MGQYDDLLEKERPHSRKHPPMKMEMRAAQFTPFSALEGYEAAIKETARITQDRITLAEDRVERINQRMRDIQINLQDNPRIRITYFVKDLKKSGGSFQTREGEVSRIDETKKEICFKDGERIRINDLVHITCDETRKDSPPFFDSF